MSNTIDDVVDVLAAGVHIFSNLKKSHFDFIVVIEISVTHPNHLLLLFYRPTTVTSFGLWGFPYSLLFEYHLGQHFSQLEYMLEVFHIFKFIITVMEETGSVGTDPKLCVAGNFTAKTIYLASALRDDKSVGTNNFDVVNSIMAVKLVPFDRN